MKMKNLLRNLTFIEIMLKGLGLMLIALLQMALESLTKEKKCKKNYLDLTFVIDSGGKLSTRLYDKRDDFDFHMVNFSFFSSNIPSGPSYGVYISSVHTMTISDIAKIAWLIDFCHKAIRP